MNDIPEKIFPNCGFFNEEKDDHTRCLDCYKYAECLYNYLKENELKKINCKKYCTDLINKKKRRND